MKKMKWLIVIIAVIAVIVLAGAGIVIGMGRVRNNQVMDGDGMINPKAIDSFYYYRGGGELNAYYSILLENTKLTVESSEGNGCKTYKDNYTVPYEVIDEIQDVIMDSGMRQWKELPQKDIIAMDGETTSVTVNFTDGGSVYFYSDLEVPDGGWDAVREVVKILENIADK